MKVLNIGRFAAILTALVAADAGHCQVSAQGYEPPRFNDQKVHYEESAQKFGRFTAVRYVEDCRNLPIMHGRFLNKEARLNWIDSSGLFTFSFIDNGGEVRLTVKGKSIDGKSTCFIDAGLMGYDSKPSTSDNWRRLQPFLHQQLSHCEVITPVSINRALAEAESSSEEYVPAANAWKGISAELFGPNRSRCVQERMLKPHTVPPRFECVGYSNP